MINTDYKPHIIALTSQFVMGNGILMLSQHNNTFFTLFLSLFFSAAFFLFLSVIIKRSANHAVFNFVIIFISALALYGAASSLYDYMRFLLDEQLTKTNVFLVAIPLIAILVIFATSRNNALYKYCLLTAVINIGIITIVFIGGIKNFDISQAKSLFYLSENSIPLALKTFLRYFSSLAVISLYIFFTKKDTRQKSVLWGIVVGFAAIAICLIQSLLTLGTSTTIIYPYVKAVGIVSSGSLFTRLDGLTYWLCFSLILIKSSVCLKVVWFTIKHMLRKKTFYD